MSGLTGAGITPQIYEARRRSFNQGAADYDRVRPEWPAETVRWLLGQEQADGARRREPGARLRVLDLGAGTGKGTTTLAGLGHDVTALEPADGMAQVLRSRLGDRNVRVVQASAEDVPLEDDSFDAVVCLQAWHWIDDERGGAQVARVLKPGGTFGLAWHSIDLSVPWVQELFHFAQRPEAATEGNHDDEALDIPGFARAQPHRFPYVMDLTPGDLAVQVGSWSHVSISPDRDQILAEVRALGERAASPSGLVAIPYVTTCYRTQVAS